MHLDHLHENASPVSVSQPGLIRLSSPARAIALACAVATDMASATGAEEWRARVAVWGLQDVDLSAEP